MAGKGVVDPIMLESGRKSGYPVPGLVTSVGRQLTIRRQVDGMVGNQTHTPGAPLIVVGVHACESAADPVNKSAH